MQIQEVMLLKGRGARIEAVLPGSPADRKGLESGDVIERINGQKIRDLVDYHYYSAEDSLLLSVLKCDGSVKDLHIEREDSEEWGIIFPSLAFDGMKKCANRCLFCFIDQMPPGMRASLYDKDDDYRWSFFQGNFITLTNLSDRELNRIIRFRLSPLYVSVHASDPQLRASMMGNRRAGRVMAQLRRLAENGIELHLQVVLCPGINDGGNLDRTLRELSELGTGVKSIGLVPVGLTGFRDGLFKLRPYTRDEAERLISQVQRWQSYFLEKRGSRLVFLGDEFYLLAGVDFPPEKEYEGYPQLENGIGLSRKFLDEYHRLKKSLPKSLPHHRRVLVVTGELGYPVLRPVIEEIGKIENLTVELLPVKNRFFAGEVKATGLLTGADIQEAVKPLARDYDQVVIPEVVLRSGTDTLLDNTTVRDMEMSVGQPVTAAPVSAEGLLQSVLGIKLRKMKARMIPSRRNRRCSNI